MQEAALRAEIAATQDIIAVESQELQGLQRQFSLDAIANTSVLAQTATSAQTRAQLPRPRRTVFAGVAQTATSAQTRAQLPPLQKRLAQTRNQLTALLGLLPDQDVPETFDLASLHLREDLPVSLPSKLAEQRPDIRAAEAQLHEMSAQIGVAKVVAPIANWRPDAIFHC